MKKFKRVILLISFSLFFVVLNGYVIAQPSKKQFEAFRSAKTVQIVVEQSYGEAKDVSLPIMDVARRLLKYAGLQVVGSNVKDCDLYIKIEAEGKTLSSSYTPGRKLYTGAPISGSISFEIPGIPIYKKSFRAESWPYIIPGSMKDDQTPSGAVFYGPGSVGSKIIEMMVEIYGITCVIAGLKDEDKDVRGETAFVLGEIKDPQAVEPLIATLKDEDKDVRRFTAYALGEIKDPRAVEPLITTLKDEDKEVREAAEDALSEIKEPGAVGYKHLRAVVPLIVALENEDKEVRKAAADALGKIEDPRAVEPLIAALNDEDEGVREVVVYALENITKKEFGENQEKWQKWWDKNKGKFLKKK